MLCVLRGQEWVVRVCAAVVLVSLLSGCACLRRCMNDITVEDLLDDPETHTMTVRNHPMDSTRVQVRASGTEGNTLEARLGDKVIWKNEATFDVTIEFDMLHPLFDIQDNKIELVPGEVRELTISADAEFGRPGYVHKLHVVFEQEVPGAGIIVCPPPPLPCN